MEKTLDNIKILCFDIDGTISYNHKGIKPEIREEFLRLKKMGYKIILNTGRSKVDVEAFMKSSDFYSEAIILNGACIIDENLMPNDEEYIDEQSVRNVYDLLRENNISFVCYYSNKNVEVPGKKSIREIIINDREEDEQLNDFFDMFVQEEISNFKQILKIEAWILNLDVNSQIRDKLSKIDGVTCVSSMGFNLEITSVKTNKAKKLLEYANKLGYTKNNVIFFGDSENDKPVFDLFENAVYVKNERQDFNFYTKFKVESCKNGGVEKFLKSNF